MAYVTADQIYQAKQMDLLTYLQNYEPQELVHIAGNTYCTREHDSLKISNGKWHWFSRGVGGRSALDYLIKVQDYRFPDAVLTILGQSTVRAPTYHAPHTAVKKEFVMPELHTDTVRVQRYLRSRGIHPEVIQHCVAYGLLFETKKYHNAAFVGYDKTGRARYAALRGTMGDFKGEVPGSDKHYSFSLVGNPDTDKVHLFESAIDLMSHASLRILDNTDWRNEAMLSLAGVYKATDKNTVPIALEQFLKDHPGVGTVFLHLDNDEVGRSAAIGIEQGLKGRCTVIDAPPKAGKDVNEFLQMCRGIRRQKEEHVR